MNLSDLPNARIDAISSGFRILAENEIALRQAAARLHAYSACPLKASPPSIIFAREPVESEPIMRVVVHAPLWTLHGLRKCFQERGARIIATGYNEEDWSLHMLAPISGLLGCYDEVSELHGDTATINMTLSHYTPVETTTLEPRAKAEVMHG
ncbi:hypothetical protein B1C78_14615 [Thioalkalivibrio denitrificans]|uniref:Elongation factor EFG domain-containing protein n=2 Tax=Thioalkalivibrio denitrificans TaxID=108003 RepID=A0A1V3NC29_9GAMM|nr:hypothetical protein B1C78_14615 [Thioalkalivibrio denitrificans]